MAQEKDIIIKVSAEDATGPALKSLEEQLNDTKKRMLELVAAGEQGSQEFQQLSAEAGKLKGQIEGVEKTIDAYAKSGSRGLAMVTEAAQGLAAGMAIAQGAAGLLGDENEDLQKVLLKVQSATALLMGVQQAAELINARGVLTTKLMTTAQNAYTAAVNSSILATKAMRIALISTGIGAVVVGLGFLAEALARSSREMNNAENATRSKEQADKEAADALERLNKRLAEESKLLDDIYKSRLAGISLAQSVAALAEAQGLDERTVLTLKLNAAQEEQQLTLEGLAKSQKDLNEAIEFFGKEGVMIPELMATMRDRQAAYNLALAETLKIRKELSAMERVDAEEIKPMQMRGTNQLIPVQERHINVIKREGIERGSLTKSIQDNAAKALQTESERMTAMREIYTLAARSIGDATFAMMDAFGKSSEAHQKRRFEGAKQFNIAMTLVDTYLSANKAYQSQFFPVPTPDSPIRGTLAAIAAVAQGLGRVAAIKKTTFTSTSASPPPSPAGVPSGGGGGGTVTPGAPPIFGTPQSTDLTGFGQNQGQSNGGIRAYVVERDIQQTSTRLRRMGEFATLGV